MEDGKDKVEDSLEFCRDINMYYQNSEMNESTNLDRRAISNERRDAVLRRHSEHRVHGGDFIISGSASDKKVSRSVPSGTETDTFVKLYGEPEEFSEEELESVNVDFSIDPDLLLKPAGRSDSQWLHEGAVTEESIGQEEYKARNLQHEVLSMVVYLIVAFCVAKLLTTYVGHHTIVEGHSMEATLSNHDVLIVDRLSYRLRDPKRYEIIIFPFTKDTYYIKRVIGLPGETLQIIDSQIYINGEVIEDVYAKDDIFDPGIAYKPIQLDEDEYFVMGDNRNNSKDSRSEDVGVIKRDKLKGRAVLRIFPFKKFGVLK